MAPRLGTSAEDRRPHSRGVAELVGVTGLSATAAAFSRDGLLIEYLDVPSPSMG